MKKLQKLVKWASPIDEIDENGKNAQRPYF
jgi:hypothetical protein